ncbi:hypothetical protein GXP74_37060 [Streptacidiphilus sp. P02-A3a]|nr:hypothetical protein GXP74_37060 [Streptacidiphilus sp. P02-A3a]
MRLDPDDPLTTVVRGHRASPEQADAIRAAFTATAALAVQLARAAEAQLATLCIGKGALEYLHDLVRARVYDTVAPWAPFE